MKKFISALLGAFITLSSPTVSFAQQYDTLLQIIVDDTGALQDALSDKRETFKGTILNYLKSVSDEYGRKDYVIVVSQYSSSNVWTGSPRDIVRGRSNQGLQAFLQQRTGGCSDLDALLTIIRDNIELYEFKNSEIVFFSSMIHTDRPCAGFVPQSDIALPTSFAGEIEKYISDNDDMGFSFYWVHDEQDAQIREDLTEIRRRTRANITIKVEAETRSTRF